MQLYFSTDMTSYVNLDFTFITKLHLKKEIQLKKRRNATQSFNQRGQWVIVKMQSHAITAMNDRGNHDVTFIADHSCLPCSNPPKLTVSFCTSRCYLGLWKLNKLTICFDNLITYSENWWSGPTRNMIYGPYIWDLCSWIGPFPVFSVWELNFHQIKNLCCFNLNLYDNWLHERDSDDPHPSPIPPPANLVTNMGNTTTPHTFFCVI